MSLANRCTNHSSSSLIRTLFTERNQHTPSCKHFSSHGYNIETKPRIEPKIRCEPVPTMCACSQNVATQVVVMHRVNANSELTVSILHYFAQKYMYTGSLPRNYVRRVWKRNSQKHKHSMQSLYED